MAEFVLFPDEEDLLISYLTTALPTVGISLPSGAIASKVPNPRPAECVVVILTGGAGVSTALISSRAQLTVDSRAATETRASEIARYVRAVINAAPRSVNGIASVAELANPANLPDPYTPEQARYTQTFVLHLSGSVIS